MVSIEWLGLMAINIGSWWWLLDLPSYVPYYKWLQLMVGPVVRDHFQTTLEACVMELDAFASIPIPLRQPSFSLLWSLWSSPWSTPLATSVAIGLFGGLVSLWGRSFWVVFQFYFSFGRLGECHFFFAETLLLATLHFCLIHKKHRGDCHLEGIEMYGSHFFVMKYALLQRHYMYIYIYTYSYYVYIYIHIHIHILV